MHDRYFFVVHSQNTCIDFSTYRFCIPFLYLFKLCILFCYYKYHGLFSKRIFMKSIVMSVFILVGSICMSAGDFNKKKLSPVEALKATEKERNAPNLIDKPVFTTSKSKSSLNDARNKCSSTTISQHKKHPTIKSNN
jgi:hypothetical protein